MHVDVVEAVGLAAASFLAQRGRVSVALVSAVESGLLPLSKHKVVSVKAYRSPGSNREPVHPTTRFAEVN